MVSSMHWNFHQPRKRETDAKEAIEGVSAISRLRLAGNLLEVFGVSG
jgi:hypothetical protein